ncbi:MAG: sortase [Dehalococcoidia bacterium]
MAVGIACGGGDAATPTLAPSPTATARPTRTPLATRTPTPSPTGEASVGAEVDALTNLRDFVAQYGEPRNTHFARVRIPLFRVDGPVSAAAVGGEIIWYDMRLWPGVAGRPGEGGNAIFSGHVDYAWTIDYAEGAYYRGKAIFGSLALHSPGDLIEAVYNGEVLTYAVTWQRDVSATGGDWGAIRSNDVAIDSITLYTCGGDFNFETREYAHRLVVRAERVG